MKKTLVILMLTLWVIVANATVVRMETSLGNVDIELFDNETPSHVANFLNYVNDGDYNQTIVHRAISNFVIQGGGYNFNNGNLEEINTDPRINAELGVSNLRGTIALAKVGNQPSGNSQWFINLRDNINLNTASGGYTVFGKVVNGMDVVDLIGSIRTINEIPVINYVTGALMLENLIMVNSIYTLEAPEFKVNAGISGGWFNPATGGQGFLFEMLPDSHSLFAAWFTFDLFQPEDEVASTIGHPGHRWFTSQGAFDGNTFSQPIALTRNGLFDSTDAVDSFATGILTIEFNSCTEAVVSYEFDADNVEGSFPITRLSGENVALCQQLSGLTQ